VDVWDGADDVQKGEDGDAVETAGVADDAPGDDDSDDNDGVRENAASVHSSNLRQTLLRKILRK